MKPPTFEYHAPETVEEAIGLLAEHGDDARILAGGQSLVPMMNFRLARPAVLVDVNRIETLADIRDAPDSLGVGAMVRQRSLERSSTVRRRCPLLSDALPFIGHVQIRNRGTIGGSISHADPTAELPVVARALDARLKLTSASGDRWVDAADFFVGYFTTAIEPTELLSEVELPTVGDHTGTAFAEYARRSGDFAIGGAAAVVGLDAEGSCRQARIALLGAGPTPERATAAESSLVGRLIDDGTIRDAVGLVETAIEPAADVHGSAEYRRGLIGAMVGRAVAEANSRALVST